MGSIIAVLMGGIGAYMIAPFAASFGSAAYSQKAAKQQAKYEEFLKSHPEYVVRRK